MPFSPQTGGPVGTSVLPATAFPPAHPSPLALVQLFPRKAGLQAGPGCAARTLCKAWPLLGLSLSQKLCRWCRRMLPPAQGRFRGHQRRAAAARPRRLFGMLYSFLRFNQHHLSSRVCRVNKAGYSIVLQHGDKKKKHSLDLCLHLIHNNLN